VRDFTAHHPHEYLDLQNLFRFNLPGIGGHNGKIRPFAGFGAAIASFIKRKVLTLPL